jgi:tRNA U34 5-methylaminomethyl-2-thiouridine-forming methyltransferase MnmC
MNKEIIMTDDGSRSIYLPEINEYYHSRFGAVQESRHVYINAGFRRAAGPGTRLHILEVGLGTGLNALLTFFAARESRVPVVYEALEPYPLPENILGQLGYPALFTEAGQAEQVFSLIHAREAGSRPVFLADDFQFIKLADRIETYHPADEVFNLVYFDAFGPGVQADLWTEHIFRKLYTAMAAGGILVTYSAKGSVRRALKAAGFSVERLPGAAGKREMTRASRIG